MAKMSGMMPDLTPPGSAPVAPSTPPASGKKPMKGRPFGKKAPVSKGRGMKGRRR